jgi:hypothetical protein
MSSIDTSDPEIQKLVNIPIIGSLFKEQKKGKKSKGLTGVALIDDMFTGKVDDDDDSNRYYNSPEFEDGETVNEKLTGKPVVDAYLTLLISIIFLAFIIATLVWTIIYLTK